MSIFETGMLICFGLAWPLNIYKSLKSRTAAGRSLTFQWAILIGYVCGIIHKILYSNDIVLYLYIINLLMVTIDTCLYFRNRHLDREREKKL
ncbi:MAG: hypothetical protein IJN69_06585 [Oscillospiraceae bacterium]|nr:hypothetical protein [Oscillospiraceae bacterium]MBR2503085.1 hypothetical protein [Oscillospiraceae bacterium]